MFLRFNETKSTQAASFFLSLRGGRMHYIKLIKLLYLADRAALLRWGAPITNDRFVSMDHGPVVSTVLDLITKNISNTVWSKFISEPLGDDEVELRQEAQSDRLSRAEEKLLREIYAEYGYRNRWDIIENVMHKLPEWKDPQGSSIPIKIRQILEAGGENEKEIQAILDELRASRDGEDALSNI
jgi:uncharacterized phage-associated protein